MGKIASIEVIPLAAPDAVARTGLDRTTSTRPSSRSNAFTRWLTADGVTLSTRAAASKVPASTTAASVSSCSRSNLIMNDSNGA